MKKILLHGLAAATGIALIAGCNSTQPGMPSQASGESESISEESAGVPDSGAMESLTDECENEESATASDASYDTTQPSLEMLPSADGFTKSDSLNDYAIIYANRGGSIQIRFYITPASEAVRKEMNNKDLTDYNNYRKQVAALGVIMSNAVFETISGKTVLAFYSNTGEKGEELYEYHYLDGENIVIRMATDNTRHTPSQTMLDAVERIIAH